MKFEKLHAMVPYVTGGKQKVLTMQPYNAICLAMPGRHASDTTPEGGDYVVMIDDDNLDWVRHQFTHTDLFMDIEKKTLDNPIAARMLMNDYLRVIQGADPTIGSWYETTVPTPLKDCGIHPQTFLYAVQALAVAEHRRYAKYETKWGGRYLPFRFAAGIVEGLWTAADAAERQKRGRPGVEWLEKDFGVPVLTKELIAQ